ncbi:MAG: CDP-diacylglycerol--serine O-phosphatidyltransferase [Myxococcota bacterium]
MIRNYHLADLITLCNAFCGTGSILLTMSYLLEQDRWRLTAAMWILLAALVFDVLDGSVARWRHASSPMGQELDSLADIVSFGVAPAALAFAMGMQGGWDAVILVYFVGCGISRLARFNVTAATLSDERGKVRYFEGTPIPSSLVLVLVLGICFANDRLGPALPWGELKVGPFLWHPLSVLYLLSGSAMISKTLRIPKP